MCRRVGASGGRLPAAASWGKGGAAVASSWSGFLDGCAPVGGQEWWSAACGREAREMEKRPVGSLDGRAGVVSSLQRRGGGKGGAAVAS
jgi:hypothetical protein